MNSIPSPANATPDLPVRAGQVLEGKFRVEIIGEGAFGLVVEAKHLQLDERVALKFLRNEARARPDIVVRFSKEARAAAKIRSDHVARVFDVGTAPDGSPFMVMEFLAGEDLEARVSRGPLPITDAAEYIIQACEGLCAAHTRGIVHRDIKPGNLFLTNDGGIPRIKLLDFGISKAGISLSFDDIDLASADTTQIMGSPHYMSPEQIRSTKDVDGRADIWSMGVVLYELLVGRPPFHTATEVTGIIAQVLYETHPTVRSQRPEVPPELEKIVDKCLVKDAQQRYQTAAELAVALLPFAPKRARAVAERASAMIGRASGHDINVVSLPPPSLPRTSASPTNSGVSSTLPQQPPPSSSRGLLIAIAFVAIALVGGGLALVSRTRTPTVPTAEPTVNATNATNATASATVATAVAQPEVPPTTTTATATTASAPGATTARIPVLTQPHPTAPRVTPKTTAPGNANGNAPATPESEIRHER